MPSFLHLANLKWIVIGSAAGILYGMLVRLSFNKPSLEPWLAVMSVSFLFVLPFAMGFLSVYLPERQTAQPFWVWFFVPWLTVVGATVGALVLLWEGWICVAMFLPVGLGLSSLGGIVAGFIARNQRTQRLGDITAGCLLLLPFLLSPLEPAVLACRDVRTVENVIDIQAPATAVWNQIKTVPAICKEELLPSWSRRIGFPDPIAATLSFDGVGGVRQASFSGGVLFIETVDVWEPGRRLAFSIHPETAKIPHTTLDEHVVVGGPYFDVLRGEYRIESLPNGVTRLHLRSWQRVSTDFNWYAHLWSDAVMTDLQRTILHVVQKRAEASANLNTSTGNRGN